MSSRYIDGLLSDYNFKAVKLGGDTKFITSEHSCKFIEFLNRVKDEDDSSEILKEYIYIINSIGITCFLKNSNATTIIDSTIDRLSTKHEILKRYLILIKLKFTERALLYKLSIGVEHSDFNLVKYLQELASGEVKFDKNYFDKIKEQLNLPNTDVIKLDMVELLKGYNYSDYKLSKKVKYALYRYYYNMLVRDYKTYILLIQVYYYLGRGMSREQLLCKIKTTNIVNSILGLEDKHIKKSLKESNEFFIGLEKALIVLTGNFKIKEDGGYKLLNKFLIPQELLLGLIDSYLITVSKADFKDNNPLSAEEILVTLVSLKDSTKLLEDLQINSMLYSGDKIVVAIGVINSIQNKGENITADDVVELNKATFSIKELSKSTSDNLKEVGTKAQFGVKRLKGTRDMYKSLTDINKDYKDAIASITSDLDANSVNINTSLATLLSLQSTLSSISSNYAEKISLIQNILDSISETINDLKQTVCLITSMMCFIKTLTKRLEKTINQSINQGDDYLKQIDDAKNEVKAVWDKFNDLAYSEVKEDIRNQIKKSVKSKVLHLAVNSSGGNYKLVRDAILEAIDRTSNSCIDNSKSLLDIEIANIKNEVVSSSKSTIDSLSESIDTDRCRVEPLFNIPKMLSWNIDGFSFGKDMLGDLDFSLRNCKE